MKETTATLVQGISNKIPRAYAAGVEEGKAVGRKEEYDAFWDAYQDYGKREGYSNAFSGIGWTAETFKPKHDLIVRNTARNMFAGALKGVDLEQHLTDLGIILDTSGVTSVDGFDYFCQYTSPSVLPVIDTTGTPQIRYFLFHTSELKTVRKVILKNDGSQKFTNAFINNRKLEDIFFDGIFGNNVSFEDCDKLSKASLTNIMTHLSPTATFTVTLPQTAVNNAFTTEEWQAVINAKPANVTVSLI